MRPWLAAGFVMLLLLLSSPVAAQDGDGVGNQAPGQLEGAVSTSVPVWAILALTLYAISTVVAASYHRSLHERLPFGHLLSRADRSISGLTARQIAWASAGAFAGLSALVLLFGPQARFADPLAYYNSIETMLEGGNPYSEPPSGLIIAYTGLFVAVQTPFVAVFGLAGPFIGAAFVASFVPVSLWLAAEAYAGRRAAGYAGALGLTIPFFLFWAARWGSDEVYFVLAVTLALVLLLGRKEMRGFATAGLLSTKFTVAIPVLGWIVERSLDGDPTSWLKRCLRRGLSYLIPYLAVFGISTALWGRKYIHGVYIRQTIERASSRLESTNLFHLAELAGASLPDWTPFAIVAVLALLFLYVLRWGPRDPVLTGALLVAGTLTILPSMSVGFVIWLLPFLILYSLRFADEDRFVSPLLAIGLTFSAHAFRLGASVLPSPLSSYVSGTFSVLVTSVLVLAMYHAISLGRRNPDVVDRDPNDVHRRG